MVDAPSSFGPLKLAPSFGAVFRAPMTEVEFIALVHKGFAVNAEAFRGFEPGMLLLNSIRRHLDGGVTAVLTPLPARASEDIRREPFATWFA